MELRIFDDNDDVTFGYNANFFLFATLENARTIAQGRVPQSQASFPVLTGTPVAGMAYLDRPNPAGYFIFPDLSVRHEGKYRLAFSLYEELKEHKDADKDESPSAKTTNPGTPNGSHVSYRLEVKSTPFTVFSAKKFPGLTESTTLSRIVAEQGCRVRIRRDVRMRRRDNKHSKDWDDYDEDNAYERARRASATPDVYGQAGIGTPHVLDGLDRKRRMSNASQASLHPSHRSSASDLHAAYQAQSYGQPPIAPQTPQQTYPQQIPYGQPNYSHPNNYAPQPAPMQPPQPQYHPPPNQYQHQPMPVQTNYNGYMPNQPYVTPQHYEPTPTRTENFHYDQQAQDQYRRQTMPQLQSQPQVPFHSHQGSISSLDSYSRPPSIAQAPRPVMSSAAPPTMANNALPPLKTNFPISSDKIEPNSPASAMPIPINGAAAVPAVSNLANHYPVTPQSAHPNVAVAGKRSFGLTFDTKHIQQPLRQGARPNGTDGSSPSHGLYDGTYDEISDSESSEDLMYKRADGTQSHRKLPPAQ